MSGFNEITQVRSTCKHNHTGMFYHRNYQITEKMEVELHKIDTDVHGSSIKCKAGSSRCKTAQTAENGKRGADDHKHV